MTKATITTKTSIEYYPLMADAWIVKARSLGHTSTFNVDDANLALFLAGKAYKVHTKNFYYLSPEQVEDLRKNQWTHEFKPVPLWNAAKAGLTNASTLLGVGKYYYTYDATMRFHDGRVIPCGVAFDYIEPAMRDTAYDVDKAFDILSKRTDLHQLQKIDVPYYNGGGKGLFFIWEVPEELWGEITTNHSNRYKYVFDNDLLGLRAGGAALHTDYWKRNPDYDDRHDDDNDD